MKTIVGFAIAVILIVISYCCKGIMTPAPKGIHGQYSSTSDTLSYQAIVSIDSILKLLTKEKIFIKNGRLNDYDAPWDSLSKVTISVLNPF